MHKLETMIDVIYILNVDSHSSHPTLNDYFIKQEFHQSQILYCIVQYATVLVKSDGAHGRTG